MRKYHSLYEDSLKIRNLERSKYAQIQFSSPEIKRNDAFKKIRKDIWYFYLIGIVVIGIVLLIICTQKKELFNRIWLTYIFILVLNTILMIISLGIIKEIIESKANKARINEESIQNSAKKANLELAKLSVVLACIDNHLAYINICENKDLELDKLVKIYIQIIAKEEKNNATSEEFIDFYKNLLLLDEIEVKN